MWFNAHTKRFTRKGSREKVRADRQDRTYRRMLIFGEWHLRTVLADLINEYERAA
jgi:hypothetical protein